MEKLRYACIGTGKIADKKHLCGYSQVDGVEIRAVCDPDAAGAERMAKKYNIPAIYGDYREMLEKEPLDFVSICTPNYLHKPIAMEVIRQGLHVHCEKPIGLNAVEAQEMVDAKNKAGTKLMMALNNRFKQESWFVKRCCEEGSLGEIYHAKCGWKRRSGIPGRNVWFTEKKLAGGGALIDLGVHYLDLALFFMGYPRVSSVSGAVYSKFGGCNNRLRQGYKDNGTGGRFDVEDMAVGFIRMENRATVDFEFSWASNIEKECIFYELYGTKGGICCRDGELKIFSEMLDTMVDIVPNTGYAGAPLNEYQYFADCIRTGKDPVMAPPEEAVDMMRVIDAFYTSAETGREVIL